MRTGTTRKSIGERERESKTNTTRRRHNKHSWDLNISDLKRLRGTSFPYCSFFFGGGDVFGFCSRNDDALHECDVHIEGWAFVKWIWSLWKKWMRVISTYLFIRVINFYAPVALFVIFNFFLRFISLLSSRNSNNGQIYSSSVSCKIYK